MKLSRFSKMALPFAAGFVLLAGACGDTAGDDSDMASRGALSEESGGNVASATMAAAPESFASSGGSIARDDSGKPGTTATDGQESLPFDRKIIFTTGIDLAVPDVMTSFTEVQRIARTAGGYVEASNLSVLSGSEESGAQRATVTLRVPADEYDTVLNSLRVLAGSKVTREQAQSNEVTEQYVDLQSRLRNLERSEEQYLTLLAKATTVDDIITVNDRLDGIRAQIEQAQGRLNVLDHMTDMATIDVALAPLAPAKVENSNGGGISTPAEAFTAALDASWEALRLLAATGAVAAVALIWLIPVGAIVLLVRRFLRGRKVTPAAPESPVAPPI